jgi:hypothetical protein
MIKIETREFCLSVIGCSSREADLKSEKKQGICVIYFSSFSFLYAFPVLRDLLQKGSAPGEARTHNPSISHLSISTVR